MRQSIKIIFIAETSIRNNETINEIVTYFIINFVSVVLYYKIQDINKGDMTFHLIPR